MILRVVTRDHQYMGPHLLAAGRIVGRDVASQSRSPTRTCARARTPSVDRAAIGGHGAIVTSPCQLEFAAISAISCSAILHIGVVNRQSEVFGDICHRFFDVAVRQLVERFSFWRYAEPVEACDFRLAPSASPQHRQPTVPVRAASLR